MSTEQAWSSLQGTLVLWGSPSRLYTDATCTSSFARNMHRICQKYEMSKEDCQEVRQEEQGGLNCDIGRHLKPLEG